MYHAYDVRRRSWELGEIQIGEEAEIMGMYTKSPIKSSKSAAVFAFIYFETRIQDKNLYLYRTVLLASFAVFCFLSLLLCQIDLTSISSHQVHPRCSPTSPSQLTLHLKGYFIMEHDVLKH